MDRIIVSLCALALISGALACVPIDEDDDFEPSDREDSSITEGDEVESGDDENSEEENTEEENTEEENTEEENTEEENTEDEEVADPEDGEDQAGPDVAGVRLSYFSLWEDEMYTVMDLELEEEIIYFDFLRGSLFADESVHPYAFSSTALHIGYYDITAQAIDEDGQVIDDCSAPVARGIGDFRWAWIQVIFPIQCDHSVGIARPAQTYGQAQSALVPDYPPDFELELIPVINYAPIIESVDLLPSATQECPATVELCATVAEPDRDPVAFEWSQLEGPEPVVGPLETRRQEDNGVTEQCVEMELPDQDGDYAFELQVFDQVIVDGEPLHFETWYEQEEYGEIESRDSKIVSFEVHCPEEEKEPKPPKKPKPEYDD
jgi:hypothetical protein